MGPSVVLVFVVIVAFVSFRWAASCALATRCNDVAARGACIMIFPFKFVSFLRFSAALGRHSLALLPEAAVFVVLSSVGLARFVPAAWRAAILAAAAAFSCCLCTCGCAQCRSRS